MAASDSRPVPIKNTAYRVIFPILDADGDLVTGAAGLDSEVSKDCGTFADCTNEATEIATSSGVYYLDLTSTEMNADSVAVIVKTTTTGAKTTTIVLYPQESGDIKVDVQSFGGTAGTFSGGRPEVNTSHIAGSAVSTSSAQIGVNVVNAGGTAWGSGAITAASIASNAITSAKIATDAIGAAQIADNAIDAGAIAADAITAAKIADGAIDLATFAADAKALFGVIAFGTAQSVTGTTIRLASAETFADDELIGATVLIRSATTGAGQSRVITDYVSATDTATVDTWTTTPTGTITYVVFGTAPASTSAPLAVNVTQFGGVAGTFSGGRPEVNTTHAAGTAWGSGAITAGSIAAAALNGKGDWNIGKTGYSLTATTGLGNQTANITGNLSGSVGSVTGAVGSVTGNVGGNVTGSVGSVATGGIAAASFAAGAIDAAAIAANAIGASELAADAVAEIADAVWDELLSGHVISGSAGEALAAAGTAGDPWTTVLPGAYGAGTAGKIIGDNLNATVSSRASQTSVDTIDDFLDTEIAAILADTNELQTDWTNGGRLDLLVDAIKAKTDNLPAAPAATGDIPTAAAVADAVWDEALAGHSTAGSAGKALTDAGTAGDPWSTALPGAYGAGTAGKIIGDNIDAAISTRLATASYTAPLDAAGTRSALGLASANLDTQLAAIPTGTENADALLGRNVAGGADGTRTVSQALYVLRNKTAISGGTLTVYGTDDATPSFTAAVGTTAGDPISSIDPA